MNKQTQTPTAAASSANDPVAQIGRDLASNWHQTWRIDEEGTSTEAHSPQATRRDRQELHLSDRR